MRHTSCGKQVLRDGKHFADACSDEDAAAIATAMDGPTYKVAWREYHERLGWMQDHPGMTRFLGKHFADIANALIDEGHPGLRPKP